MSKIDIASRDKWEDYSKAKDEMLAYTDTKISPWYVVEADDKRKARLNCISHIMEKIQYKTLPDIEIVLKPRIHKKGYVRPPKSEQTSVPDRYLNISLPLKEEKK